MSCISTAFATKDTALCHVYPLPSALKRLPLPRVLPPPDPAKTLSFLCGPQVDKERKELAEMKQGVSEDLNELSQEVPPSLDLFLTFPLPFLDLSLHFTAFP